VRRSLEPEPERAIEHPCREAGFDGASESAQFIMHDGRFGGPDRMKLGNL
jgi:hypothetical protein